jgi:alginate O-acetyltransferase complex protein AlgJ
VPTKAEVYPDRLDRANARFVGQVVNPWARKFLLDLSAAGVEAIDLWPPLLAARRQGDDPEPLYQRQDTHWTSRGLRLAASAIAARVREYPWWSTLPGPRVPYTATEVPFRRPGDLHARLADRDRRGLAAEALVGHQVKGPDGRPFEPDPESPIVVLGDSYAASYELVDCRHAGVAAHLARELGRPVDLVTSYGGGPNVRRTLWRAGEALARKRLVVYLMTARDLHAFPGGWAPLEAP